MPWSFSASLWVVGLTYSSALNSTHWEIRPTVEVDDCGPPNMNSPGYALWLVLVPAVACVVHLQGSVLFCGRSRLYRLAPEMGLADALATLGLVVRAVWEGYAWREAVMGVLLVREGIGREDVWWRKRSLADGEPPSCEEVDDGGLDSSAVDILTNPSPEPSLEPSDENRIQARLLPYARPPTIERTLGGLLLTTALIKAIAVLFTPGAGSAAVSIPAVVAMCYSPNFIILEALVWSLSFSAARYSVADIPQQNLLEVLRFVDSGGDLSSSASVHNDRPTIQDTAVELESVLYADQTSEQPQHTESAIMPSRNVGATSLARLAVVCACLGWLALLYNIWRFSRAAVATSVACILAVLGSNLAASAWRALVPSSSYLSIQALHTWIARHATVVHVLPLLWVVTICTYVVLAFPEEVSEDGEGVLREPAWLDWLG